MGTVLAELYGLQPKLGYYLLYYLKSYNQLDTKSRSSLYKDLMLAIDHQEQPGRPGGDDPRPPGQPAPDLPPVRPLQPARHPAGPQHRQEHLHRRPEEEVHGPVRPHRQRVRRGVLAEAEAQQQGG